MEHQHLANAGQESYSPAPGEDILPGKNSFMKRYAYAIKAVIIGFLVLVLLIPTAMIMNLIREREQRSDEATAEISSKWGEAQTLTGPIIIIPYLDTPGHRAYALFLPDKLSINGELLPEMRHRGIYETVVYSSHLQVSGNFAPLTTDIPADKLLINEAVIAVGVSDMRGISNQPNMQLNGKDYLFSPGVTIQSVFNNGMQARIPLTKTDSGWTAGNFSINLDLRGSGQVHFSPVGKTTQVNITSNWANPQFDGQFLPVKSVVKSTGFTAAWQVSHLNRNFPQSLTTKDEVNLRSYDFGIKLFLPVDGYQQSTRAVKYAILIIGLSFLVFYFIELLQRLYVHPLQYILIGFALVLFYTLLIALAEQLNFGIAYLIASGMTIVLVTAYTASIFNNFRVGSGIGGVLVILYGAIYVILRAEDLSLLMGSLGLFIILAIVMFFSRKIKWKELKGNE
ncbi:cell envelope integrity protein CreD [Chitinophaga sp. LS1]|uniref:cell envelope integrity protein CreD n=1 Tax=Chitinophaga sp. LS1 TaxID=3051176 RepID=UPI002AAAB809|nr:cell envelope integrity protein CreD [Chitinophaga sp. LS1]WPV68384.1 cell envelope integrity protein CreD [Chitinophaga sp. LS1]